MQPNPIEVVSQLPRLAPRAADSNKGSFGRVLIVGGSRGMSGAAVLCGAAALRGGAGLVRVAVPSEILPIVAGANPCYLTAGLLQDNQGRLDPSAQATLLDLAKANDVIAAGPGLGQSAAITHLVDVLLSKSNRPLVLDADGLNAVQRDPGKLHRSAGALIITPHPGEFARLVKKTVPEVQAQRQEL